VSFNSQKFFRIVIVFGVLCFAGVVQRAGAAPVNLPTLQRAKIVAADKANGDSFGTAVSISADGRTAIFGAPQDDVNMSDNGSAYVYVLDGGVWQFQAKLLAADRAAIDLLGQTVALSADGNTAIIGAYNRIEAGLANSGAAYVFTRSGTTWTQQAKLLASDKATNDSFGWAVALSNDGDTALIGAPGKSDSGTTSNGASYIFTRNGTTWTQQAKVLASDKGNNAGFGIFVALAGTDGNTALIGAYNHSDPGFTSNGAAYVYTRSGTIWTQQAKLSASDKASSDLFGISVALSADGNTGIVGAYLEDESPNSGNGAAYVYTRSGTTWTQQAKLLAADRANNDDFGQSVALSADGNTALVGALFEDDPNTTNNGAAYLFTRSGTTWTQQYKLLAADKASNDYFGRSVALPADGNTAVVSAYQKSDSGTTTNGAVYIFGDPMPTATPTATLTATATQTATVTQTATATPSTTPSLTATFTNTATNTPVPPRPDTIGLYKNGTFYLRNSNTSGPADITVNYGGDPSDLPVTGDWNGDGVDTIGIYRSSSGVYSLSDSNITPTTSYTLVFGNPGDTPFAGRWTVSMTHDGVGVYRNSNGILYQKEALTTGFSDYFAIFGNPGDKGFAGDWNGDGLDSIGVYRSSIATWYLTNNSTPSGITFSDVSYGWNIGTHLPLAGDWDGNLVSTGGEYDPATSVFLLNNANGTPTAVIYAVLGSGDGLPIAGKWVAGSVPPIDLVIIGSAKPDVHTNADTSGAD
jgi:hypothetical protein